MEIQKKVLRVLLKNYSKISRNGGIAKVIFDDKFEDIAEDIVKLFSIPVVSNWVACKEKMPPNDSMCIVYRSRLEAVDYAYYDEGFEFPYTLFGEDKKEGKYKHVTHWQPLPEPPCC
jgi:hypothetical protein